MSVAVERGKRVLDIALSGLGLLVSWPLWGIIALAIWIDDGPPIFYFQDRVGRGGRLFRVWKFRSMITDAERDGAKQARAGDDRITSVGRWLRATALDELPQLWNIFRGDMSFVGPRALRPGEIEVRGDGRHELLEEVPGFEARCAVRPGLTGWLAETGNTMALRDAILAALSNDDARNAMSAHCRRIAIDEYSMEVQSRAYLKLYETLLARAAEKAANPGVSGFAKPQAAG